jgi:GT2 family glycosyltransferase
LNESPAQATFSVVIPTLGRPRHLQECLAALARLDYAPHEFEVVVVNDGGGRAVEDVVAGGRGALEVRVLSTAATGPSGARNTGAAAARGRFLAFTDDDCEPDPGWLGALERRLAANPAAAVGGTVKNGAAGRCAVGSQVLLDSTHSHFNRDPAAPRFFASNNLAVAADDFRAIGGFDESFLHAEDRELCERWHQSGRRLVPAPEAVVRHMRHLTPREFWRQHFSYGRGAWNLHQVRAERDWGQFSVEPSFYSELARQAWRRRDGAGRPSLVALGVISQVANAAGFAREAAAARLGRRPHRATIEGASG